MKLDISLNAPKLQEVWDLMLEINKKSMELSELVYKMEMMTVDLNVSTGQLPREVTGQLYAHIIGKE